MLLTYIFPEISYRVNLCCEPDDFQKIYIYLMFNYC